MGLFKGKEVSELFSFIDIVHALLPYFPRACQFQTYAGRSIFDFAVVSLTIN